MKKLISCEFNIDSGNVECLFTDGTMLSIICEAAEDSVEAIASLKVRTELDRLIYEAPIDYVQLVLTDKLNDYLKSACDFGNYGDFME